MQAGYKDSFIIYWTLSSLFEGYLKTISPPIPLHNVGPPPHHHHYD